MSDGNTLFDVVKKMSSNVDVSDKVAWYDVVIFEETVFVIGNGVILSDVGIVDENLSDDVVEATWSDVAVDENPPVVGVIDGEILSDVAIVDEKLSDDDVRDATWSDVDEKLSIAGIFDVTEALIG